MDHWLEMGCLFKTSFEFTQQTFTCSISTIETLGKGTRYVLS